MTKRKYEFSWDVIGVDLHLARPSLGPTTRMEVYRLFQFTLRDVLEQRFGHEMVDTLFREAGALAGKEFYNHFCKEAGDTGDISVLVKTVQDHFKELSIGIFRVEMSDLDNLDFVLTVDEDLDCSGLPDNDDEICVYDEGFIQGIFEAFTGKPFKVRETDCWCSGARTCRFSAKATV